MTKRIKDLVDELQRVQDQRKSLEASEKIIKQQLTKLGAGTYEGSECVARISEVAGRKTVDMQALRIAYQITDEKLAQFEKVSAPSLRIELLAK